MHSLYTLHWATIALEPKMRTTKENSIFQPKMKHYFWEIVSVCASNVRSYIHIFIFRHTLLHPSRILNTWRASQKCIRT